MTVDSPPPVLFAAWLAAGQQGTLSLELVALGR